MKNTKFMTVLFFLFFFLETDFYINLMFFLYYCLLYSFIVFNKKFYNIIFKVMCICRGCDVWVSVSARYLDSSSGCNVDIMMWWNATVIFNTNLANEKSLCFEENLIGYENGYLNILKSKKDEHLWIKVFEK